MSDQQLAEASMSDEPVGEVAVEQQWPKGAPEPGPDDTVAVLMTESMARTFEQRCLGTHTVGFTRLAGPLFFCEDDVPTYIIGVGESQ
jgi:hypothetical protein